jgi:hypothetical protein
VCPRPLSERKGMLSELIGDANPFGAVHLSEHFEGDGPRCSPRRSGCSSRGSSRNAPAAATRAGGQIPGRRRSA